jgi:hypothetical protein|tara:strand:- start:1985 stop:2422 length:438 start_codon:yes stop_codon:yes gene_type:complete
MSYKGKYKPSYPKKYKGDPTNIIYRSLWERKFMVYCDNNPNVLEWQSEEFCIPYRSPIDNKVHRYFPDFFIKYKDVSGKTRSSLIEIKPMRQCVPPPKPKRQTKKYLNEAFEYAKNQAKWKAAEDYCADRMWEFKVMTEKELGIK